MPSILRVSWVSPVLCPAKQITMPFLSPDFSGTRSLIAVPCDLRRQLRRQIEALKYFAQQKDAEPRLGAEHDRRHGRCWQDHCDWTDEHPSDQKQQKERD